MGIFSSIFGSKPVDKDGNRFIDGPAVYQQAWEQKQLPGPGAENYAFETLQLAPFTPIGRGIFFPLGMKPTAAQSYLPQKSVVVEGIPTMAGQMAQQPLFDPENGGYTGELPMPRGEIANPPFYLNDPRG